VVDPDEVVVCEPARCADCGGELADSEQVRVAARQLFDVPPPPPRPHVTEYRVVSRRCACGTVTAGAPPAWVVGSAGYGPELAAPAANMLCGHYLPVGRSAELLAATLGVTVSTGFLPRVRDLLHTAGVLPVDETPGRAGGSLSYVHVACTEFLTALHTGTAARRRSTPAGVLPGYTGVIVRDGYAGYTHLVDARHAWCGAHLLRDLRAFHDADPDGQV
jgi:transposase